MRAESLVALALAGLALSPAACSGSQPAAAAAPPSISAAEAEGLLLRADDARSAALAGAGAGPPLSEAFAGGALSLTQARVSILRERGLRRQLEPEVRRLVHLSVTAGGAEAVLEVRARERSLRAGDSPGSWAITLRQWWVRIEPAAGGWRVVEDHDLPPDRWWRS